MVIPRLVERALTGEPLEIHGDGTQTRCFCHVADTVRALSALMDSPTTGGEIYNVGSQQSISILDLARRVLEMTRSDSELRFVPYEEVYGLGIEDMYHRVPATEKIAEAVGWRATLDLDVVLADVIKHLRTTATAEEEPQREEARSGASAAPAARTASE
jgi:UDP-glucose 4-epimerase